MWKGLNKMKQMLDTINLFCLHSIYFYRLMESKCCITGSFGAVELQN
jgi:hypothetical protein